jgi:hypothetical protein
MIRKFSPDDEVFKTGGEGGYDGPGIVVAVFQNWMGQQRCVVGHKIDGGKGLFYHIYAPTQLELQLRDNEKEKSTEPVITEALSERNINTLLEALGYKGGDFFATRIETKLNALKGTRYVDRYGQLTERGRLELERRSGIGKDGRRGPEGDGGPGSLSSGPAGSIPQRGSKG